MYPTPDIVSHIEALDSGAGNLSVRRTNTGTNMKIINSSMGHNPDLLLRIIGSQIEPASIKRHGLLVQVFNLYPEWDLSAVNAKTCSLKVMVSSVLQNLTLAKKLHVVHIVGYESSYDNDEILMRLLSDTQVNYKDITFNFWLKDMCNIPNILEPYQNKSRLTSVEGDSQKATAP